MPIMLRITSVNPARRIIAIKALREVMRHGDVPPSLREAKALVDQVADGGEAPQIRAWAPNWREVLAKGEVTAEPVESEQSSRIAVVLAAHMGSIPAARDVSGAIARASLPGSAVESAMRQVESLLAAVARGN